MSYVNILNIMIVRMLKINIPTANFIIVFVVFTGFNISNRMIKTINAILKAPYLYTLYTNAFSTINITYFYTSVK